jgi:hypothetical protein
VTKRARINVLAPDKPGTQLPFGDG